MWKKKNTEKKKKCHMIVIMGLTLLFCCITTTSFLQAGGAKAKSGFGAGVSVLLNEEDVIPDSEKSFFDWVKENDIEKVTSFLQSKKVDVNEKDTEV